MADKDCDTCLFGEVSGNCLPCRQCSDFEQWEDAKNAGIILTLRSIIEPLLKHAERDDYAPPYMFNVCDCRKIKELLDDATIY